MATSAYRTAVINDTPVFYAPLDEASSPVEKKSGAVLQEVNAPTAATSFESGWTFNGSDECLLAPATDLDQVAGWIGDTGAFSLELWFKQNNGWSGSNVRFMVRWGGYGIFLRFYGFPSQADGYLVGGFYSPDAAERNVEEYGSWFDDSWHHAVVTFDRPTLNLYVDGVLVQTESRDFEVQITDTVSDFIGIGRNGPFAEGFFPGTIDDVAIYNYALTESQIDAHYAASRVETVGDDPVLNDPSGAPRTPPEGIASSFHANWNTDFGLLKEVRVDLTVTSAPTVEEIYFWALQVDFYQDGATPVFLGGGHTGLQHNPSHPNDHAVNWGGYDDEDSILSGTTSSFPSTPGNDNTRDYDWEVGESYTFRIWIPSTGTIRASIDGTTIRDLYCAGADRLANPTMWSEVFARCSDPSASVRWSNMRVIDADDVEHSEDEFLLTYQAEMNDGCPNTNTYGAGLTVRQVTNTTRTNVDQTVLTLEEILAEDGTGVGFIPIA